MEYLPTTNFSDKKLQKLTKKELIEIILEVQESINSYIDYED